MSNFRLITASLPEKHLARFVVEVIVPRGAADPSLLLRGELAGAGRRGAPGLSAARQRLCNAAKT